MIRPSRALATSALLLGAALSLLTGGCADMVTDIVRYGALEVEAVRRNGEPVQGVEFILYNGVRTVAAGQTGPEGWHRFPFLPPTRSFGVYAQPPPGYERPEVLLGGPTTAFVAPISLEEGEEKSVRFTYLKVGDGRIGVTVQEPTGEPVLEARVSLFSPLGTREEKAPDSGGRVTFDPVPFGNWGIRVAPPEVYLEEGESTFEKDGIIIEEGVAETAAFTLDRCLGWIRAQVQEEGGGAVASYPVTLYRPHTVVEEGATGADGRISFGPLLCRSFGIRLEAAPGWRFQEGPGKSYHDGITLSRGSDLTFLFTLTRAVGRISGVVVDQEGAPVSGATLELFTAQAPVARTTSQVSGTFAFLEVEPGVLHGVRAFPPEGFTVAEGRGSSFFDGLSVEIGQELVLRFVLTRN